LREQCGNHLNGSVTGATGGHLERRHRCTFNPNNTTLNATYTHRSRDRGGHLTLTLTTTGNGNCIPVTSDKVITFTPAPTS
jgi:hypothetical protein